MEDEWYSYALDKGDKWGVTVTEKVEYSSGYLIVLANQSLQNIGGSAMSSEGRQM